MSGISNAACEVTLTEDDIPGAKLSKPYNKHTISALRWWLLCRGIEAPTPWKKQQILDRVLLSEQEQEKIVDVDGSYTHRKYECLKEAGEQVLMPSNPPPPLTGWKHVTDAKFKDIARSIPQVTSGLVYTYLAGHVGHFGEEGAFRALERGYAHWASGRLQELQVNTNQFFCHVKCTTSPSMKGGIYKVYMLLGKEGDVATICSGKCDCAAGMSASCTHVSALLHALAALSSTSFQFQPNLPSTSSTETEATETEPTPIASTSFEQHEYRKPVKRKIKLLEDFDPQPPQFRGQIQSRMPAFLESMKGEQMSISFLLDSTLQQSRPSPTSINLDDQALVTSHVAFKETLKVSRERIQDIERSTREQRHSSLWFSARRYRVFGSVFKRRPDTPPDNLVLSIIQPRNFSSAATRELDPRFSF
ncbi:hypothetical protein EMCRGX_G007270 [Ephydatia muelleri]